MTIEWPGARTCKVTNLLFPRILTFSIHCANFF